MQDSDVEAAVNAALSLDWEKAKNLNSKILSECPNDIDCLNRLGRAFLELGNYKKAASCFKSVLKISKYDPIALKNLARLASLSGKTKKIGNETPTDLKTQPKPISFLDEPGKTRLIPLVNVAPTKILLSQNHADPVTLSPRRHTILVEDKGGNYLGALPDDLSHRIFILMKGGNKYEGYVKSVAKNAITVFVRETSRAKRFKNTPSFLAAGGATDYLSFVREEVPGPAEEATASPETGEDEQDGDFTPGANKRSFDEPEET